MFKKHDQIVHSRYGAGTVVGTRKVEYDGKKREYFIVNLNGDRGVALLPIDSIEDSGAVRAVTISLDLIKEVLRKTPREMPDDYRERQPDIREKLKSRNPKIMLQALRDLAWFGRQRKLTGVDEQLLDCLYESLAGEFALKSATTAAVAKRKLREMVNQAMDQRVGALAST